MAPTCPKDGCNNLSAAGCKDIVCTQCAFNHIGRSENSWGATHGYSAIWNEAQDNVVSLRGPNNKVVGLKSTYGKRPEFFADASLGLGAGSTLEEVLDKVNAKRAKVSEVQKRKNARKSGQFIQNEITRLCVYYYDKKKPLCACHEVSGCQKSSIFEIPGLMCFNCMMEAVEEIENDFDNMQCKITFIVSSPGLVNGKVRGDVTTITIPITVCSSWKFEGVHYASSPEILAPMVSCLPISDLLAINDFNLELKIFQSPYANLQEMPELFGNLRAKIQKGQDKGQAKLQNKREITKITRAESSTDAAASNVMIKQAIEAANKVIRAHHSKTVFVSVNKGTVPFTIYNQIVPAWNSSIKQKYEEFLSTEAEATCGFMFWLKSRIPDMYKYIKKMSMKDREEISCLTRADRGAAFIYQDGSCPKVTDYTVGGLSKHTVVTNVAFGNQLQALDMEEGIQRHITDNETDVVPLFDIAKGQRFGNTSLPGMVATVVIGCEAMTEEAGKYRLKINAHRQIDFQMRLLNAFEGDKDQLLKEHTCDPISNVYLDRLAKKRERNQKKRERNKSTTPAQSKNVSPQSQTTKKRRTGGQPKDDDEFY